MNVASLGVGIGIGAIGLAVGTAARGSRNGSRNVFQVSLEDYEAVRQRFVWMFVYATSKRKKPSMPSLTDEQEILVDLLNEIGVAPRSPDFTGLRSMISETPAEILLPWVRDDLLLRAIDTSEDEIRKIEPRVEARFFSDLRDRVRGLHGPVDWRDLEKALNPPTPTGRRVTHPTEFRCHIEKIVWENFENLPEWSPSSGTPWSQGQRRVEQMDRMLSEFTNKYHELLLTVFGLQDALHDANALKALLVGGSHLPFGGYREHANYNAHHPWNAAEEARLYFSNDKERPRPTVIQRSDRIHAECTRRLLERRIQTHLHAKNPRGWGSAARGSAAKIVTENRHTRPNATRDTVRGDLVATLSDALTIRMDADRTCHAPTALLYDGDVNVGHAQLSHVTGPNDEYLKRDECDDDIRRLAERLARMGHAKVTYWTMWRSELRNAYIGKGFGVDLYEAALRFVHARFGVPAIIFPEMCMDDGTTSVEAEHVWGSLHRRWESEGWAVASIPLQRAPGRRGRPHVGSVSRSHS